MITHKLNRKIIKDEFKRRFKCTRVVQLKAYSVDYWEQDMLVSATIYKGIKKIGRKTLFFQFSSSGVISP